LIDMVDFHAHILPGMDDGAENEEMSLEMMAESYRQGVRLICATSHFYADEENPARFIARRDEAFLRLREAAKAKPGKYPAIVFGAEVLYFPGMSGAEELSEFRIGASPFLLVEPPMHKWSETMLDEIELTGKNLGCIPVIAHIDRYIRYLQDNTLFERVKGRRMLTQVNASFFINQETALFAIEKFKDGSIHFIGSDCHNVGRRAPNIGPATKRIIASGAAELNDEFHERVLKLICPKGI